MDKQHLGNIMILFVNETQINQWQITGKTGSKVGLGDRR